jgi:hypothetical protein
VMLRVVCLHNDTPIQKTECAPGPPLVRAAKLTRFAGQICDENRMRIDPTPASKRHHCGACAHKMQAAFYTQISLCHLRKIDCDANRHRHGSIQGMLRSKTL